MFTKLLLYSNFEDVAYVGKRDFCAGFAQLSALDITVCVYRSVTIIVPHSHSTSATLKTSGVQRVSKTAMGGREQIS